MLRKLVTAVSLTLIVTGCGGEGTSNDNGAVSASTGQFKDSNIAGLNYKSASYSGVTDASGKFNYKEGETTTFSIGGITLGTSSGKSVVTPLDMVPESSSDSVQVQNMVRFLMMLDGDGDPSNGIKVSTSIQTIAKDWSPVNFGATDLSVELKSIIADVELADTGVHTLPSAGEAKAHFESTFLCAYAGAYKGTYSGDDTGYFGVLVDASNGNVAGVAYSTKYLQYIDLSGETPVSFDQNVKFSSNSTSGTTFSGNYTSVNKLSGVWENSSSNNGDISGVRIGGAINSLYRFTGNYKGTDRGLFSFDIDSSNQITGVAYSVDGDQQFTLSGSISGTELTAKVSDGTTIAGILNLSTGDLSGTWENSAGDDSGSFSGNGCKLN